VLFIRSGYRRTMSRNGNRVMIKQELERLQERAQQLKEKRPGYGAILDFYVKVREAQITSKASLKPGPAKQKKRAGDCLKGESSSLIEKDGFPVDMEAAKSLFHTLCRIGKNANPHMAEQIGRIEAALEANKADLETLLTGQKSEQAAADLGLNRQVLSFLIQSSIRPSIEAGMEQLRNELEPETGRTTHCPVCSCLPDLNLLRGEGGMRYSLCSCCGYSWRIDRLSCAVCGNKEPEALQYFYGEGEEACRIDLCDQCHHYIKTIDTRNLEASDPYLEDIATLHLDVVAVQKGYKRSVPNPWST
jgi:FdhE protein